LQQDRDRHGDADDEPHGGAGYRHILCSFIIRSGPVITPRRIMARLPARHQSLALAIGPVCP